VSGAPGAFVVAVHRQEALGRICRELREIYTAPTLDVAEAGFGEFADAWRDRYPAMINTWEQSWGEFVPSGAVVSTTMKSSTVWRRVSWVASGRRALVVPFLLLDDRFLRLAWLLDVLVPRWLRPVLVAVVQDHPHRPPGAARRGICHVSA
jgi:hypothetical protein